MTKTKTEIRIQIRPAYHSPGLYWAVYKPTTRNSAVPDASGLARNIRVAKKRAERAAEKILRDMDRQAEETINYYYEKDDGAVV